METPASAPLVYFVSGMWCTSCARGVRDAASLVEGVLATDVNYANKILRVELDGRRRPDEVDAAVRARVDRIGFGIKRQAPGWTVGFREELAQELDAYPGWPLVAAVWFLAMWSSMLAFARYAGGGLSAQGAFLLSAGSAAFGLPAILIGVAPYASSGMRALLHGRKLSLDLFVFLGGVSATLVTAVSLLAGRATSYADSGSMVIALLLLTKKLENTVVKKVSSSLLFQIQPEPGEIAVWKAGAWHAASAHQARRGDRVRFGSRSTVSLDGVACSPAKVETHLLSGESSVVDAAGGDPLLAGMIAVSALEMIVTEPVGHRRIDRWAESALTGGGAVSPYPGLYARAEAWLTTAALAGAGALSLAAWLGTGSLGAAAESFFIGILVFCPCLFATILPLAKQLAHLALLRGGVELSRSEALLDLCRVRHFCFDKTGTLEEISSRFEPFDGAPDCSPYLHELAFRSQHPILRGLVGRGGRAPLHDVREIPGLGLSARTEAGERLVVGRPAYLRQNGAALPRAYDRDFPLVALGGLTVGQLVVKRIYDAKSRRFLARLLRACPGADVEILSGDPAAGAGDQFRGIDPRISFRGDLAPEEKARRIRPASAFVGDGLNDTLALAKADVSVRVGRRIAGFAPADLRLRAPNLDLLLRTVYYARKYRRVLAQTALAALTYNAIAFGLAYSGRFSPLGAVLAMMLSFFLLLLSTLRLLYLPEVPK